VEDERIIWLAKVAGGVAVGQVAASAADRFGHHNMARHLAPRALEVGQHTADVRMLNAAGEEPAGLHHLMPRVMNCRGCVIDRTNQRELVGVLSDLGKDLGDAKARHVGVDDLERPAYLLRRIGLWIKGVNVAWPADEK